MSKVTPIGKKVDRCQFCGGEPACYIISCPRLEELEIGEDGAPVRVKYRSDWKPVPPDADEPPSAA
jgi:hypothetical protein